MDSNENITKGALPSRRKFVWGIGIVSVFAAVSDVFRFPFSGKKNTSEGKQAAKNKLVTLLTQDGRLVQVDQSFITANKKQVTNGELQHWIKK